MIRSWLCLFFVWLCAAPAASGAGPRELLEELRRAYASVRALEARFVQVSRFQATGVEQEARGRVFLARGGRMRWIYEGDDPQEIVSDGTTLWIHQIRDRTVLRQDLASLPPAARVALDLLDGLEGVEQNFELKSCGERCLALIPRRGGGEVSRVEVRLARDGPRIVSVTTVDAMGNRTRIRFEEMRTDPELREDTFVFRVPEGVQVLGPEDVR